jgi:3-hydroxyacyl-CoA dehydrogenase / enoyl-CoA hydratase / 3-hydroxybutyryl-CoA epimerase
MISIDIDTQGIGTMTWDMPGRSQNVLNGESSEAYFNAIEQLVGDPAVKGICITSAKRDFIAGGDLKWLLAAQDPQALFDHMRRYHRLQRLLETCGKPVAVALPGTALGGGLEIAMAAHHRVAADNPKARIGQPECQLGLLPGGGGTQRLPRMIGIQASLPLLMEGKRLTVHEALKLGIVDAVVPEGELLAAAKAWLASADATGIHQPWDRKGWKLPGGAVASPGMQQMFTAANAMLRARTFGNLPNLRHILSCVYEGLITDIDTGLTTEARYFVATVMSPEAKAIIRTTFFGVQQVGRVDDAGVAITPARKVGVLGAGMMGAGIAQVVAKAGLEATLLDTSLAKAEQGKAFTQRQLARKLEAAGPVAAAAQALLDRIRPTADYAALDGADLVIEAVFEDRALKADVTARAEAMLAPGAIFASNTSTLPITGLAAASRRPGDFIGLHFFSPAEKMPLVEVIVGQATSRATVARAVAFVRQIGKTPIVVNDSRGFYTSRVFGTYIAEGMAMLAEGVAPALIDNAGLMAGMPVGPLALVDEVSAELVHRVEAQTRRDLGDAYRGRPGYEVADRLVALGRLGKKAGQGFYDHPEGGRKSLWKGLAELYPPRPDQPPAEEVMDRLITVQCVEAARCLAEGVVSAAIDADVGAILGWGFPAFRGGPFGQIHREGVATFVARAQALAAVHGERFAPPQQLVDIATRGDRFYAV